MRDRWRICRQRAIGLVCGLGLVLALQLAPQVSMAATELACECEAIEVVASASRRGPFDGTVIQESVATTAAHLAATAPSLTARAPAGLTSGHTLPNGSRAPLRC